MPGNIVKLRLFKGFSNILKRVFALSLSTPVFRTVYSPHVLQHQLVRSFLCKSNRNANQISRGGFSPSSTNGIACIPKEPNMQLSVKNRYRSGHAFYSHRSMVHSVTIQDCLLTFKVALPRL